MSITNQANEGTDESGDKDVVLEIRDATVSFEMDRGRARVLNDINIDIHRGETFGIVGESGCGKSMFASAILDAVRDPGQLSGSITYYPEEGDPIDLLDLSSRELRQIRWEEIAIVSQGAMNSFNPVQNIRTHFIETFAAHDVPKEAGLEQAKDLLERLSIDPDRIMNAFPDDLSGGESQRVMLALSLVLDPEVLIMDEPTAGLDLLNQRNVLSLIYDIKEEYDLTLLFISHDIPIISGFADRIGVMYAFEMIEHGDAEDVIRNPEHPYTRLLLKSTLDLETTVDLIEEIEGEPPDPINIPSGCPFHPRCPVSDDRCEIEDPELRAQAGDDHRVACFYPDEAVSSISLSFGDQLQRGGDDQ